MKNVIVDTCVFITMRNYHEVLINHGEKVLFEILKHEEKVLKEYEKQMLAIFPEKFLLENENLSFAKKIDKFYEDEEKNIEKIEHRIQSLKKEIREEFTKNGVVIYKRTVPEEIKIRNNAQIDKLEKELEERKFLYDKFVKLRSEHKSLRNSMFSGKLLAQSVKGEISLHITATVYRELAQKPEDGLIPKNQQLELSEKNFRLCKNHFTLISTYDSNISDFVDELAKAFRTGLDNKNLTPMAMDINSNGEFGDSLIMAESNLSGMYFVSLNEQDFIFDNQKEILNERKRDHIMSVCEKSKSTTNAQPLSVVEYYEVEYPDPKQSKIFELKDVETKDNNFKNEVHIELKDNAKYEDMRLEY